MKNLCTLLLLFCFITTAYAQSDSVKVNSTGSALLEMDSNNKGLLVPRLSTTDRTTSIANPATGLLVYDIDLDEFCYYSGSAWICGWGSTSADSCETLDTAYDCDMPGDGRTITVDAGAVQMNGSIASPSQTLDVNNKGTGAAGKFSDLTADGMGSETFATFGQNMGNVALFEILGAGNAQDAVYSYTNGLGRAGLYQINLPTSSSDALEGYTLGTRHGVTGVTGFKNALVGNFNIDLVPSSGTVGLSTTGAKRMGTSGVSVASDGVWGKSFAATSGYTTYSNMDTVIAGVHGSMETLTSSSESKDFFGVYGITSNNGNGVFGIGGGSLHGVKGHGVMGISAWSVNTPSTNAGVWGISREGSEWGDLRARFPLEETLFNKVQVGVLGQSCNYVGVWGESLNKIGVVGTTTTRLAFDDLEGIKAGLFAYTDTMGYGAVGQSSVLDLESAGVMAIGMGGKDIAQALQIHDGAIRVTKTVAPDTPADKISMFVPWTPIHTCFAVCPEDDSCPHDHKMGFSGLIEIPNIYADPERSVILLTPEWAGPGFSANLDAIVEGSFFVQVNFYKPEAHCQDAGLPNPITIHYLIVNK